MTTKPTAIRRKPNASVVQRDDLTPKERLFFEQYFIHKLNGTEAAMNAYNCKDRTVASVVASEVLARPKIRARVDARLAQFHMQADEVLARMAVDARSSMEDFIDEDSGMIDLKKAARAKSLGSLKKYRTKFTTFTDEKGNDRESTEVEIELYDGQAARRDIAKHLGLFVDRNVSLNVDLTELSDDDLAQIAAGKLPARKVDVK